MFCSPQGMAYCLQFIITKPYTIHRDAVAAVSIGNLPPIIFDRVPRLADFMVAFGGGGHCCRWLVGSAIIAHCHGVGCRGDCCRGLDDGGIVDSQGVVDSLRSVYLVLGVYAWVLFAGNVEG